jgi:hypothetical protein
VISSCIAVGVAGCQDDDASTTPERTQEATRSPSDSPTPDTETPTEKETPTETETPQEYETSGEPPSSTLRVADINFDSGSVGSGVVGAVSEDGKTVVCGGTADGDAVAFAVTTELDIRWTARFPNWQGTEDDPGSVDVATTADSAYLLAAQSVDDAETLGVLRLSGRGELVSVNEIDAGEFRQPQRAWVESLSDGTYLFAWTESGTNDARTFLRRYDADGSLRWEQVYRELALHRVVTGHQVACALVGDRLGRGFRTVGVRADGATAWTHETGSYDFIHSTHVPDGYLLWGPRTEDGETVGNVAAKLSPGGSRAWRRTYDGPDAAVGAGVGTGDRYRLFVPEREGFERITLEADGQLGGATSYNVRPQREMEVSTATRAGDTTVVAGVTTEAWPYDNGWIASI